MFRLILVGVYYIKEHKTIVKMGNFKNTWKWGVSIC